MLDDLAQAMRAYNDSETTSVKEDRVKPYVEKASIKTRMEETQSSESDIKRTTDNEFIKSLDLDIRKTEESLKEMNERFRKIKET